MVQVRHATAFTEIPMSTRMMVDHMPKTYVRIMDRIMSNESAAAAPIPSAREGDDCEEECQQGSAREQHPNQTTESDFVSSQLVSMLSM